MEDSAKLGPGDLKLEGSNYVEDDIEGRSTSSVIAKKLDGGKRSEANVFP